MGLSARLLILLTFAFFCFGAVGCGADGTSSGASGNQSVCGEGTVFVDGQCVLNPCGDGTVFVDGQCVLNPCGEGTIFVDGQCVVDTGDDVVGGDTVPNVNNPTDTTPSNNNPVDTTPSNNNPTDTTPSGTCSENQRRCNGDTAEVCVGGGFITDEACPGECFGGFCQETGDILIGSCFGGAVPLTLDGETVLGTIPDFTTESLTWSTRCTSHYDKEASNGGAFYVPSGPQNVYKLNIPSARYVKISVEPHPSTPTYFGLYLMADCKNDSTYIRRACSGSLVQGGTAEIFQHLAPGDYNVIVDTFGTSAADLGDFTIKAESQLTPVCSDPDRDWPGDRFSIPLTPKIINFDDIGYYTDTSATSAGDSYTVWHEVEEACPGAGFTNGSEKLYGLALRERHTVRFEVTSLSSVANDSGFGLDLRTLCGDNVFVKPDEHGLNSVCANGSSDTPIVHTQTMEPGQYFLFIDEKSASNGRDFQLVITLDP